MKDKILKIVSHHTQNVSKKRTLEELAELENETVDKLHELSTKIDGDHIRGKLIAFGTYHFRNTHDVEVSDIEKYVDKYLANLSALKTLTESNTPPMAPKPKTFELWMESKGYRQNSKKQWMKHVYTMDGRTLNNFKLEYENL